MQRDKGTPGYEQFITEKTLRDFDIATEERGTNRLTIRDKFEVAAYTVGGFTLFGGMGIMILLSGKPGAVAIGAFVVAVGICFSIFLWWLIKDSIRFDKAARNFMKKRFG